MTLDDEKRREWQKWFIPDEEASGTPFGQGDLVLVPSAALISTEELPNSARFVRSPRQMAPDSGVSHMFDSTPDGAVLDTWARTGYSLAIILTHDCGFDQDYLRYVDWVASSQGLDRATAEQRARLESAPWLRVAPIWAVSDLPEHQREDAKQGRVGFLLLPDLPAAPIGAGPFVASIERTCCVSWRTIDTRFAAATPGLKRLVQRVLCYADAARNIEVIDAVTRLFGRPIRGIEPLEGFKNGRTNQDVRSRIYFEDGDEAQVTISFRVGKVPESQAMSRPTEQGRRERH